MLLLFLLLQLITQIPQAMDQSHVSLVSVLLNSSGFEDYRCDSNCIMGISLDTMTKVRMV